MATEANKTRLGTTKSDEAAYENALLKDPRLDLMKRVVMNCCILITILGNTLSANLSDPCLFPFRSAFQYVLLAMACLMFNYSSKTHLVLFGLISSMQLVCAPLGYYGIKTGNRLYLMVMAVVNTVWMVSTLVFIIVYMISKQSQRSQPFNQGSPIGGWDNALPPWRSSEKSSNFFIQGFFQLNFR